MQRQKEFYFKIIIVLFNLILLLGGAFILFWFDIVEFEWSRKLKSDYEYNQSKAKEKRILVLGDSQLEFSIAEQSIAKLMYRFCKKNDVGFANAAHYGFGPNDYLDRLEEFIYDYQPDLVILFYNVHNDLTDVMLKSDGETVEADHGLLSDSEIDSLDRLIASKRNEKVEPKDNPEPEVIQNKDEFDWDGFRAYGFDEEIIQFAKNRLNDRWAVGHQYVNPHVLVLAQWKPDFLTYNLSLADAQSRYMWYKILKTFEKMMEICSELNSNLAIVALPSTLQVDDSHVEFYQRLKMTTLAEWTSSSLPQDLLDTFCLASTIQYLDVLPSLRDLSDKQELYYPNDDHLNDNGQTAVYRLVEESILKPFVLNESDTARQMTPVKFYKNYGRWKREYHIHEVQKRLGLKE